MESGSGLDFWLVLAGRDNRRCWTFLVDNRDAMKFFQCKPNHLVHLFGVNASGLSDSSREVISFAVCHIFTPDSPCGLGRRGSAEPRSSIGLTYYS